MSIKQAGPVVVDPFGTYSSKKGHVRLLTDDLQTLSNLQRGPDPSIDSGFKYNVHLATTIKKFQPLSIGIFSNKINRQSSINPYGKSPTYPKDKSNLRLSVNLGSDMDQKGKIWWIKVPYISAPEALNSVKGIRHFGLKPPKFGGHGTRAP